MDNNYFLGRRIIYTDEKEINADNIAAVIRHALITHNMNKAQTEYLYGYLRGKHPVLFRTKDVRPEINNKVIVNVAEEIVNFYTGYIMGEPVQYINRGNNEKAADGIRTLNDYMISENKIDVDNDIAEWMLISGVGYRLTLPDETFGNTDEAPFEMFSSDPRYTFVVRNTQLGNPVVLGVTYTENEDGEETYYCYTSDRSYILDNSLNIISSQPHLLGSIPIIEYPASNTRMGVFEGVLSLLDSLDSIVSNRCDAVEQFVQALMIFHNVDITEEGFAALRKDGAIKVKDADPTMKGDISYLTAELNQTQTQVLVDYCYKMILQICGVPNRNGGSSTSDTGQAVMLRDGWSAAETRAKRFENKFKKSEREFLKLVTDICRDMNSVDIKSSDIDIKFTRRNYENIAAKSQVLIAMLSNPKIAPQLAFTYSNMFPDPEEAYKISMDSYNEYQKKLMDEMESGDAAPVDDDEKESGVGYADKSSFTETEDEYNDKASVNRNGYVKNKTEV